MYAYKISLKRGNIFKRLLWFWIVLNSNQTLQRYNYGLTRWTLGIKKLTLYLQEYRTKSREAEVESADGRSGRG